MPTAIPPDRVNAQIGEFFEAAFQARLERSPQWLTMVGSKLYYDHLDDVSEEKLETDRVLAEAQLQRLHEFDYDCLTPANQLDFHLFEQDAHMTLMRLHYRHNEYLMTQKFGVHTDFPAFMINMHRIDSVQDAQAYLDRLHALSALADQVIEGMERRATLGIIPPVYLFGQMIEDCRRFIDDTQSAQGLERHVLFEDFRAKLAGLKTLTPPARQTLLEEAKLALRRDVLPTYQKLIDYLTRQAARAPAQGGASSLPDGPAYYRMCLERHTSTTLSADEIHALGLDEVGRLQREIQSLQPQLGFRGNLEQLFSYAREHAGFYYSQDAAGRHACLSALEAHIEQMSARLPALFGLDPKDRLQVKAVEPHREKTAGLAFYEGPSADGSRPGIFHVNLHDLRQLPVFSIEALAYHEALPGHHLQFSVANHLHDLPRFRRYLDCTAYVEGWALYSERLASEIGMYDDPWSDFGRLTYELKRACRLVVDTGLHARSWTRQQAIDYLYRHTPFSLDQAVKEIDRYLVMPGQATAYTVGMQALLRLRSQARALLGECFDLADFHFELLRHGPLPLPLLEQQMHAWFDSQSRANASAPERSARRS